MNHNSSALLTILLNLYIGNNLLSFPHLCCEKNILPLGSSIFIASETIINIGDNSINPTKDAKYLMFFLKTNITFLV